MREEDKIKQVFYEYEMAGLINGDPEKVLSFVTEDIMGFGMGEQGFVSSKQEIQELMLQSLCKNETSTYTLNYEDVIVHMTSERTASLCGKVYVKEYDGTVVSNSGFMQSLSFVCQEGRWLICALHASPIIITEEMIESFPMSFAENTLMKLRSELQEEAFQFLSRSLSVGILGSYLDGENLPPFYVNDTMLKQLGYSKEEFFALMVKDSFGVVHSEDKERAQQEINQAIELNPEYTCQYRLVRKNGEIIWIVEHGKLSKLDGRNIILSAFVDITELMKLQLSIQEKNATIVSSITYAARIQRNLLPSEQSFQTAFSDYSILWSPKDIVGGDIYWLKTFEAGTVLCVGDCTGHGIPGALLTVLVSTTLDNLIKEENCSKPAQIIFDLDCRGAQLLHNIQSADGDILDIKDGCDIAVLFIARDGTVTFSSANIPVFVCNGQEVKRYRGQRLHIGEGRLFGYEQIQQIQLPATPEAVYYVASDGLFDQTGEAEHRSFGYQLFQKLLLEQYSERQAVVSQRIWEAFEEHRGIQMRRDDVELISFRL